MSFLNICYSNDHFSSLRWPPMHSWGIFRAVVASVFPKGYVVNVYLIFFCSELYMRFTFMAERANGLFYINLSRHCKSKHLRVLVIFLGSYMIFSCLIKDTNPSKCPALNLESYADFICYRKCSTLPLWSIRLLLGRIGTMVDMVEGLFLHFL